MTPEYQLIAICSASALLASWLFTWQVRRTALRSGMVDRPNARSVHTAPVPRLGGVAFACVALLTLLIACAVAAGHAWDPFAGRAMGRPQIVIAVTAIFLLGLLDDLRGVRASLKALLILAAAALVCSAARIDMLWINNDVSLELGYFAWPLSISVIVVATIGMNFIDGLDGLAGGIFAFIASAVATLALVRQEVAIALVALVCVASVGGFLIHNWHPARIFMGDGGSMFLGFTVGVLIVTEVGATHSLRHLTILTLAAGVPLLDLVLTMLRRRLVQRRSFFSAERGHLHHRLLDLGVPHKRVVLLLYGVTLLAVGLGLVSLLLPQGGLVITIGLGAAAVLAVFAYAGSIDPLQYLGAFARNHRMSRQVGGFQKVFDEAQNRLRNARSFDQWWQEVMRAADELAFTRVQILCPSRDGTDRLLEWRHPAAAAQDHADQVPMRTEIPVRHRRVGGPLRVTMEIANCPSLELCGRRMATFARLLQEHGLDMLPSITLDNPAHGGPLPTSLSPSLSSSSSSLSPSSAPSSPPPFARVGFASPGDTPGAGSPFGPETSRATASDAAATPGATENETTGATGIDPTAQRLPGEPMAEPKRKSTGNATGSSTGTSTGRPISAIGSTGVAPRDAATSDREWPSDRYDAAASADAPSLAHRLQKMRERLNSDATGAYSAGGEAPMPLVNKTRIAIVHDFLYTYAGAEKVLEQMLNVLPQADVFSLFDFLPAQSRDFLQGKSVTTSFIQRMPLARTKHRQYLPLMPLAIEQLDVSAYDIVISSSYVAAKGVITRPDQLHLCYCHSPVRFAWDMQHQYLHEAGLARGIRSMFARTVLHYIRNWDARCAMGVDSFVTNSDFVGRRIEKVYRRQSHTIYPPVDTRRFTLQAEKHDFYLTCSRMVPYKKIDLIVQAFSRTPERRLIVIGDGPQMDQIKASAGSNVRLLGYQSQEKLIEYMQRARGFVFAAEEDFGIAPVEAMACGTPVIAFGRGGVTESVVSGKSGVFFHEQTPESVIEALHAFERIESWDHAAIRRNAERFAVGNFREEFRTLVEQEWARFWKRGRSTPRALAADDDSDVVRDSDLGEDIDAATA